MNQELQKLISLQDIDNKIFEIESLAGSLPERIEVKENSIEKINHEIISKNTRIDEIEKENRILKADTEDGESKLDKHKDQLYLVKSNKEYDALNLEIDHLKKIISGSEEKYISFESEKEELLESIKELEQELTDLSGKMKSEKNQLHDALQSSKVELEKLNAEKKLAEGKINNSYLTEYTKLKNARGAAVTPLNGECCGNCYVTLPAQVVVEIRTKDIIHFCTSCGVFLFWEEEEE